MILSIINTGYAQSRPKRSLALMVVFLAAVLLQSCAAGNTPKVAGQKISVVTTFYPLQYLAQRIGGENVNVATLTPAGAEPHDWEPSPADIVSIRRADLFVYNGSSFEPWTEGVVKDLPKEKPLVIKATDVLDAGSARKNEEGRADPHIWLDPDFYQKEAQLVAAAMAKADPSKADRYAANAVQLKEDLARLAEEFKSGLSSCQKNTIVVSHEAYAYLARRFDIQLVSIAGMSPETEPSPAHLREIVRQVRDLGVKHIFFETLVSPAVAETIARETGAGILVLDPLEGLTPEEIQAGEDYLSIMRKNLTNLRTAVACR